MTNERIRQFVLAGVLAVAFLQYYFLNVMLEINSLPTVVVFVPVDDLAS